MTGREMDGDNFREWLHTLRFTTLGQAAGTLFRYENDTIAEACCLGVGQILVPTLNPFTLHDRGLPTIDFIEWLGLSPEDEGVVTGVDDGYDLIPDWPEGLVLWGTGHRPDVYPHENNIPASTINDDWGLTFSQIADVFEYFGIRGVRFREAL